MGKVVPYCTLARKQFVHDGHSVLRPALPLQHVRVAVCAQNRRCMDRRGLTCGGGATERVFPSVHGAAVAAATARVRQRSIVSRVGNVRVRRLAVQPEGKTKRKREYIYII